MTDKILSKSFFYLESSVVSNLGAVILSKLMPKMYPLLQRFTEIAINYYKSINCYIELLICNNDVSHSKAAKVRAKVGS